MPDKQLFNTIFPGAPDTDHLSILQKATREYPYFSVAHYFLLKETGASHPDHKKIAARTALHFNNPFLLNYLLDKKIPVKKLAPVVSISPAPKELLSKETDEVIPVTAAVDEPTAVIPEQAIEKEVIPITAAVDEPTAVIPEQAIEKVEEKTTVTKEELIFEPLHTTDYFASQGIKLSEEAQPTDKLGKQLKSFTEWLKTMKKVHEGKLPAGNENMDAAVQQLAEKSNKEDEILTESMAEVYMQQGKFKKAHEIYEKLSLLNPTKSAYFAAKIEILKEN